MERRREQKMTVKEFVELSKNSINGSGGNYVKKMVENIAVLKWPEKKGIYSQTISHDGWCDIFKGKECNCNPDIYIEEIKYDIEN